MGPLTKMAENLTDMKIDHIIDDAKKANSELHIKDMNGKVTQIPTRLPSGGKDNIDNNS